MCNKNVTHEAFETINIWKKSDKSPVYEKSQTLHFSVKN